MKTRTMNIVIVDETHGDETVQVKASWRNDVVVEFAAFRPWSPEFMGKVEMAARRRFLTGR